jgi:hypothetical protein
MSFTTVGYTGELSGCLISQHAEDAKSEQMRELELLRREYEAAIRVATDPDEKWRLYRVMQELNTTIERLTRRGEKRADLKAPL